jgi:hypothetical protein
MLASEMCGRARARARVRDRGRGAHGRVWWVAPAARARRTWVCCSPRQTSRGSSAPAARRAASPPRTARRWLSRLSRRASCARTTDYGALLLLLLLVVVLLLLLLLLLLVLLFLMLLLRCFWDERRMVAPLTAWVLARRGVGAGWVRPHPQGGARGSRRGPHAPPRRAARERAEEHWAREVRVHLGAAGAAARGVPTACWNDWVSCHVARAKLVGLQCISVVGF